MTTFNPHKCIGCKNISETKFPFGLHDESGKYFIDTEGCAVELDGKTILDTIDIEYCPVCNAEIPCGTCGGTGEITVDEQVYPGEPHMAPIGSRVCPSCSPTSKLL